MERKLGEEEKRIKCLLAWYLYILCIEYLLAIVISKPCMHQFIYLSSPSFACFSKYLCACMMWQAPNHFHKSSNMSRTHHTAVVFLACTLSTESLTCVWIAPRVEGLKWHCVVSFLDSFKFCHPFSSQCSSKLSVGALPSSWIIQLLKSMGTTYLVPEGPSLIPGSVHLSNGQLSSQPQIYNWDPLGKLPFPAISPLEVLLHSGRFSNYYI